MPTDPKPRDAKSSPIPLLAIVLAVAQAAILVTALWMAGFSPSALDRLTQEDGMMEWLTFLALTSAGLAVWGCWHIRRSQQGMRPASGQSVGMLLVGLVFLLGAMEEISWGQRIFAWKTPEFFSSYNAQKETNLHNLRVAGIKINKLVFGKILFVLVVVHNVTLPMVSLRKPKVREFVERVGGFLPPFALVGLYLVAAVVAQSIDHDKAAEILECLGALHYLGCVILTYGLGHGMTRPAFSRQFESPRLATIWSAALIAVLIGASWLLALTTMPHMA